MPPPCRDAPPCDTIRRNEHTKNAGTYPAEKKKKKGRREIKKENARGVSLGRKKNNMIYNAKPLFFLGN